MRGTGIFQDDARRYLAHCHGRFPFDIRSLLGLTYPVLKLLPYLVLDKQTIRKLVKFVKTVRLIMLELRARRSATSDTITIPDPERHVSLDLDDDIIIPPSDGISAAPTPTMMRWSHFGRASSRPTSLPLRVVKYKEARKEREDLTDGHFDMSTLTELYACRSSRFSHFGSLNKVLELLILFVPVLMYHSGAYHQRVDIIKPRHRDRHT